MINLLIVLAGIAVVFVLLSLFITILSDAPFIPTNSKVIRELFETILINPQEVVYDLGSGDGRLLIACVRKFGVKEAVGIERSLFLAWYSRYEIWRAGLSKRIKIIHRNFWSVNLSRANLVFCFLLPKAMQELKPKLTAELSSGTRVVSFAFSIHDWRESEIYHFSKNFGKVMIYRV